MKPAFLLLTFQAVFALGLRADTSSLSQQFMQQMAAHHYGVVALDHATSINHQTVEAKINGQYVTLLVDSGCPRTCLTAPCAQRLHLSVTDSGETSWGVGGVMNGHDGLVAVQSLSLSVGELNRPKMIRVLPKDASLDDEADGIFGLDLLDLNAAIIPVGGTGFFAKPGGAPAADISSHMTQIGYRAAAISIEDGQIWTTGHINGTAMRWLIDTGASFSAFRLAVVQAAVGHALERSPFVGLGADGRQLHNFSFNPKTFELGGLQLPSQMLMATPAAIFDHDHFDGLVGVDLMGKRQAVIDLGGRKLWLR